MGLDLSISQTKPSFVASLLLDKLFEGLDLVLLLVPGVALIGSLICLLFEHIDSVANTFDPLFKLVANINLVTALDLARIP